MGKVIVLTVLSFIALGVMPVFAVYDLGNPEAIIEEKCLTEWGHNPRMQAACIEQQQKILEKSRSALLDPRLKTEDISLMREHCARDWPDDFRQRVLCENQQIRAFQKLLAPPPRDVTLKDYSAATASCSKEWPDDFRRRAHCLESQLAEMRRHHELNGEEPKFYGR